MTEGPGYIRALDGMRACAVLAVVAYHSREALAPGGTFGVSVFFVLSGYLITGILLRELQRTGSVDLKRFYVRRALRLLPALVCVVVLGGAAFAFLPDVPQRADALRGAVGAITYTASPIAASGEPLGSFMQTWTLSVEEYFYFVWPVVLLVTARRFARHTTGVVVGFAVAAVAYWIGAQLWSGWPPERLYYAADTRAAGLLIGCALAVLMDGGHVRVRVWHATVAGVFVVLEVLSPYRFVGDDVMVGAATAVVIARLVSRQDSWLSTVLSLGPLTWIGRRSYGIYLWNPVLAGIVSAVVPARMSLLPVILVLSLAVPALSYRYVELPFLRLRSRPAAPAAMLGRAGVNTADAG